MPILIAVVVFRTSPRCCISKVSTPTAIKACSGSAQLSSILDPRSLSRGDEQHMRKSLQSVCQLAKLQRLFSSACFRHTPLGNVFVRVFGCNACARKEAAGSHQTGECAVIWVFLPSGTYITTSIAGSELQQPFCSATSC